MAGRFNFNTAIAAVMELLNELTPAKRGAAAPGTVRFALEHGGVAACRRSRRTSPPTPTTG